MTMYMTPQEPFQPTPPAPLELPESTNFMYALMKAVMHDQQTMARQQLVDAQSTLLATKFETAIYNYWKGMLDNLSQQVSDAAARGDTTAVKVDETLYSNANIQAHSNESQQDAMIQSTQGQTQADASNLAQKAQLVQGILTILTTLNNLLGNVIA